jgi:2-polyprenyl-3-methyl-5-hydroxy-6-metoxy-1,4-benzoquinol methylase
MNIKQQLQQWNKQKWELKNHAMYATYARNKWPWYNEKLDPDIEEFLNRANLQNLHILDLGTCSGSQGIALARLGHRVVGTDVSKTALAQANLALGAESGLTIRFMMDDITESQLAESQFDLVLDRGCYHSICCFQHEDYVAGVKRVLKANGTLLLKTMSSDEQRFVSYDTLGDQQVQMPYHFARQQLQELMSPHFDVLEIRDSYFFSNVVDPPARARFGILRNRK